MRIEKTLRLESHIWPVCLGLCVFQGEDELIIQFEVFGKGQMRPLLSAWQYTDMLYLSVGKVTEKESDR